VDVQHKKRGRPRLREENMHEVDYGLEYPDGEHYPIRNDQGQETLTILCISRPKAQQDYQLLRRHHICLKALRQCSSPRISW
jgi:hypothetical protein